MRVQPATTYRELPPEACELAAAVRTWKRRKAWARRLRWLAWALVGLCGITRGMPERSFGGALFGVVRVQPSQGGTRTILVGEYPNVRIRELPNCVEPRYAV